MRRGAYGQTLADAMRVSSAPAFVTRQTLRASHIAVTDIVDPGSSMHETVPMPPEDGLLVMAQMRDWPERRLWEDGKPIDAGSLLAGSVTLFDLRKAWFGVRSTPVHYTCFYLPRAALDEIGEAEGLVVADEFPNDYRHGNDDPTLWRLAKALGPAFARAEEANDLFVDHITTAACAHILRRYGRAPGRTRRTPAQLSRPDLNRSLEAMDANLDGKITTATLAGACGLTITEFRVAFEHTTGVLPHRWLVRRRVERAVELLRATTLPLSQVATATGFMSLLHMRRAFRACGLPDPRADRTGEH